jgi:hypothetical protein
MWLSDSGVKNKFTSLLTGSMRWIDLVVTSRMDGLMAIRSVLLATTECRVALRSVDVARLKEP